MRGKGKRTFIIKIISIVTFTLLLVLFRILWIHYFEYTTESPKAINGELDLRNWDFDSNGVVNLSGEWTFYPYALVETESTNNQTLEGKRIQVPGDWSKVLNDDEKNPYGFGTYHLRIFVKPEAERTYSLRISSVRSASSLYVNGLLVGKSGEVGESNTSYFARNIPYTSSSIRADGSKIIDIYLQATNYKDSRSSGLVRSVRFGYEEDVLAETHFSTLLQTVAATIFFIYAIFLLLIYAVGIKDKRLLYFSLSILLLAFISFSSGDEKVFNQYVEIDYEVQLKLINIVLAIFSWSLAHAVGKHMRKISKIIIPFLSTVLAVLIMVIVFMPMTWLETVSNIAMLLVLITLILSIIALLYSTKEYRGNLWITFSVIAIVNNSLWWFAALTTGIKVVYYPFDLIIAVICLTVVWFRHYYQLHQDTVVYANKLSEIDKMKDEFLVNISHELRNPLHSILNLSEAILTREKQNLQHISDKNLRTVLAVSRRMSLMLDELLDMNAIKEGIPKVNFSPTSLQAVISVVIEMLSYSAEGKQLELINEIENDFPFVNGDENRLTQVLFNLLHNAIKYTNEGKIVISGNTRGKNAYISVSDTGVGMSEETTREIFQPYAQGEHSNNIEEGGFGIGLYVCKQLIELHGGSLFVTSTLGEGTTFTFSLPLADAEKIDIMNEKEISAVANIDLNHGQGSVIDHISDVNHSKNKPRIIIVDDDPVNNEVIETILGNELYDITSVLSAEEVLNLLDKREWDLVIADVMMPEVSGYELTKTIRSRFTMTELPVLLVTARSGREDIEIGFSSGANDYVTKPVDAVELQSRVHALTNVRKSLREQLRMESAWLQAQIKPHFLFNTLNSIIALSHIDIERMGSLLNAFSDVLRAKFNFENLNDLILIENELSVIESYLHIEKERFGERLRIKWEVDENISVMIPTLSIQPLVENAVNHGVMSRNSGGTIIIRVTSDNQFVHVLIEDDGAGMDEQTLEQIVTGTFSEKLGIGLINIDLRLKRLFGDGLHIQSEVGSGTTVSFKVPHYSM